MSVPYCRDMWKLLTDLPIGDAAEIGVAEGRFSEEMLGWPVQFPRVYLVDRWACEPGQRGDASSPQSWHDQNLADTFKRVDRFGERAVFLRGDSVAMAAEVPDRSLIYIFIDADHSFEGVMRDIEAWFPKMVSGGVMTFHDYLVDDYNVKEAVDSYAASRGFAVEIVEGDKMEDAAAYFRVP